MTVIFGVDRHKSTHAAVAIGRDEWPPECAWLLSGVRPSGCWPGWNRWARRRTWAVESAGGLGKLLVQRLVEAGEHVVDVPRALAARVRLVGSTKASKNDSNDALATAIAGLRHCGLRAVRVGDHTAVLGMLIDRYDDLVALRTQAASSPSRPTGSTCSRSVLVIVGRPDPSLTCP